MLTRPRAQVLRRTAPGDATGVRVAALLAVLLAAAAGACAAPPEPPPSGTGGDRAGPPPLWIAVTNRGNRYDSDADESLVPIARQIDGAWDNAPWAGILYIDGPGPGIEAVKTGDGVWSWPDASRYWEHPGRAADTLGRPPDVIARGVPRSWFLHSPSDRGRPLTTAGLVMTPAQCDHRWAIRIAGDPVAEDEIPDGYGPPGIALSRPPAEVLSEDDIPGLDGIRRSLGFGDISERTKGDRSFQWLGLFRFDDIGSGSPAGTAGSTTLGVLWGLYYEGAEYIVIRLDGDGSRVLVRTTGGSC